MVCTGTMMTGASLHRDYQSVAALVGQIIGRTFANGAWVAPVICAGKLRGLAVQNNSRPAVLRGPGHAEAGGTRGSIITRLNAAVNDGMRISQIQRLAANISRELKPNTTAAFAQFISASYQKMRHRSDGRHTKGEKPL